MASADAEPDGSRGTATTPEATSSTTPAAQGVDDRDAVRLRIHNLPPGITEEQLSQLFSPFGGITELQLIGEDAHRLWTAYVTYAKATCATAALQHFDGKVQLEGAPMELYVHPARDADCDSMGLPHLEYSWLSFQGFPASSSFRDIEATFQRFGRVTALITTSSSSSSSGPGTVMMATQQQARAAIQGLDTTAVEGGKLRVAWAEYTLPTAQAPPAPGAQPGTPHFPRVCTVRYSGVPRHVPPTDVAVFFARHGAVVRVAPCFDVDVQEPEYPPGLVLMAEPKGAAAVAAVLDGLVMWPGASVTMAVTRLTKPRKEAQEGGKAATAAAAAADAAPAAASSSSSSGGGGNTATEPATSSSGSSSCTGNTAAAPAASSSGSCSSSGTSRAGADGKAAKRPTAAPKGLVPLQIIGVGAGRSASSGPSPPGSSLSTEGAEGDPSMMPHPMFAGCFPAFGGGLVPVAMQGYGPRPALYGMWPMMPHMSGFPMAGYPGPLLHRPLMPPPGGWNEGLASPSGAPSNCSVTYVVDGFTGEQKPAYRLADGRLLIAPEGDVTMVSPPGSSPRPPLPPPRPPAGPPPPPRPPSTPPPAAAAAGANKGASKPATSSSQQQVLAVQQQKQEQEPARREPVPPPRPPIDPPPVTPAVVAPAVHANAPGPAQEQQEQVPAVQQQKQEHVAEAEAKQQEAAAVQQQQQEQGTEAEQTQQQEAAGVPQQQQQQQQAPAVHQEQEAAVLPQQQQQQQQHEAAVVLPAEQQSLAAQAGLALPGAPAMPPASPAAAAAASDCAGTAFVARPAQQQGKQQVPAVAAAQQASATPLKPGVLQQGPGQQRQVQLPVVKPKQQQPTPVLQPKQQQQQQQQHQVRPVLQQQQQQLPGPMMKQQQLLTGLPGVQRPQYQQAQPMPVVQQQQQVPITHQHQQQQQLPRPAFQQAMVTPQAQLAAGYTPVWQSDDRSGSVYTAHAAQKGLQQHHHHHQQQQQQPQLVQLPMQQGVSPRYQLQPQQHQVLTSGALQLQHPHQVLASAGPQLQQQQQHNMVLTSAAPQLQQQQVLPPGVPQLQLQQGLVPVVPQQQQQQQQQILASAGPQLQLQQQQHQVLASAAPQLQQQQQGFTPAAPQLQLQQQQPLMFTSQAPQQHQHLLLTSAAPQLQQLQQPALGTAVPQTGPHLQLQQQQHLQLQQRMLGGAPTQLVLQAGGMPGGLPVPSPAMHVAGLQQQQQQPLLMSVGPGGEAFMTYDMPGLGVSQQLQYISSDALSPAAGDGVTYAVVGDPPGLVLPNSTMAHGMEMVVGQGMGLVQHMGGGATGAMFAGGDLGQQLYVLTPVG